MALVAVEAESSEPNDPKAVAMALIAALTFNVIVGSVFGTPGVLLKPMAARLDASMEMVSAGTLAVLVSSAVFSPLIGSLAVRLSLRLLLAVCAIAMSAAWLVLAFTSSYAAYLAACLLLMGPAMAIGASIVPPTLVTRWFGHNRGLAIGLVHLPIVVAAMPPIIAWAVENHGLGATFLALAALPLLVLLPAALFLIDRPPGQQQQVEAMIASGERHSLTIMQLLRQPVFWALCLAVGVVNTSSTSLGVHLVSMAESWDVERMDAAWLNSVMSGLGLAGSVLFGLLADRVGGARTLLVIALGEAVMWSLFLAGLPYAGLAVTVGLIGMMGSGALPGMSKALADSFGRESFSRAMGLMVPVTLPLLFVGMIGPGTVFRLTGSYRLVVFAAMAAFAVAAVSAFAASRNRITPA